MGKKSFNGRKYSNDFYTRLCQIILIYTDQLLVYKLQSTRKYLHFIIKIGLKILLPLG